MAGECRHRFKAAACRAHLSDSRAACARERSQDAWGRDDTVPGRIMIYGRRTVIRMQRRIYLVPLKHLCHAGRGGITMDAQCALTPRQSTLLLFLDGDPGVTLDPVRIMKGLFLVAQQAPEDWLAAQSRYSFEAYHYGPFSADIYQDIVALRRMDLVECHEVSGQNWCRYSLTDGGRLAAKLTAGDVDTRLVGYIGRLRDWVTSLSFNELLTAIYDRYPEYARNSVFSR